MQPLSSSQAKYLRGLAHGLKPAVRVGRKGITAAVLASVAEALGVHELIKVKFLEFEDRALRSTLAAEIAEKAHCALAGQIGNIAVFYRPHPTPERRRIRLPPPTTRRPPHTV
jgi:RNA-binding protein